MAHRKPDLPEKPCAACGRPFAWRRKWARCWAEVRYCSEACRAAGRNRHPASSAPAAAQHKRRSPAGGA